MGNGGSICSKAQLICPNSNTWKDIPRCVRGLNCEICDENIVKNNFYEKCNMVTKCDEDDLASRTDGCSIPSNFITDQYRDGGFKAACHMHDYCYKSGYKTQRQCDDDFYYNVGEATSDWTLAKVYSEVVKTRDNSWSINWGLENCKPDPPEGNSKFWDSILPGFPKYPGAIVGAQTNEDKMDAINNDYNYNQGPPPDYDPYSMIAYNVFGYYILHTTIVKIEAFIILLFIAICIVYGFRKCIKKRKKRSDYVKVERVCDTETDNDEENLLQGD